jgi:hypothetical protein
MTACDDCFGEFLHPLVHELMEKNDRFRERYGFYKRWDWDSDEAELTFSDPCKPTLRIAVTVVGTTQGSAWQWTWANSNFPSHSKSNMEQVREFGESRGFEKLTTAFLEADEHTGWEMTAVAAHVLNAPGAYRFPTELGHCYLIYRNIEEVEPQQDHA